MKFILSLILCSFILTGVSWAGARDIELVPGRDYASVLQHEIAQAKTSITACLYLFSISLTNGSADAMHIADALAAAHDRGVRVQVILDGGSDWGGEDGEPAGLAKNRAAYDYLSGRGVDVFFSTVPATVHAKAVVFDESTVLIGSTNWSEQAFSRNVELNLLARDPVAAQQALHVINAIGRRQLPPPQEGARLPADFLTPARAGAFAHNSDERSFDLYLWLLKATKSEGNFSIPFEDLAKALGLPVVDGGRQNYQGPITTDLKKLDGKYGLIRLTPYVRGGNAEGTLLPLGGDAISIPTGYWDWGWDRRLPLLGKLMYLINLQRSASSPLKPRWSAAEDTLVAAYGLPRGRFSDGTIALRRANLVAVDYDVLNAAGEGRSPSIYTPHPLYDPAALPAAWAALAAHYGPDKLTRAQRCAALVYADSDVDAVERFILLEGEFGQPKVDAAYALIAAKAPSNPKRSVGYFIQTVRGLAAPASVTP